MSPILQWYGLIIVGHSSTRSMLVLICLELWPRMKDPRYSFLSRVQQVESKHALDYIVIEGLLRSCIE
jgi:hypothetical protein